jgi:SAM-dependent MidA family methyltransferase
MVIDDYAFISRTRFFILFIFLLYVLYRLTPVELFKPVYAQAVLSWILSTRASSSSSSVPLRIIEIGGGSGTLADGILSTLQREHPTIYDTCTYTIIDLSAPFVQAQQQRLAHHGTRFQSVYIDICVPHLIAPHGSYYTCICYNS